MKVLVNYEKDEKKFLSFIGAMLKAQGVSALVSHNTLSIEHIAKLEGKIDAIVCCNQDTLQNIAHGATKASVTLDSFRGSVLQYRPPVLIVNALHHIKSVTYGEWLLKRDLRKLQRIGEPIEVPTFTVLETEEQFERANEILNDSYLISIDIETDQLARITCISFTVLVNTNRTASYVIPFHDFGEDHFQDAKDFERAIFYLRRFCKNHVPKVMFNAGYDASYLIRYGAEPHNLVVDVMGIAHSYYSELPKTLDFVCSLWDHQYIQWKVENAIAKKAKDIRGHWYYCVKDSYNTLKALLLMWQQVPRYVVHNYQMKFKLTYPCLYCAFEGFKVDAEIKQRVAENAMTVFSKALVDLRIMADDPTFNPGSWQQVQKLVYTVLGAREIKGQSTDAKVLAQVGEQHPILSRVVNAVITYREEVKAFSTYFNFKEMNGRLLYNLGPFATDTGRMSSRGSNFYVGTQVQNIPPYAKEMLIADDGFTLFEPDNNKSEARIVSRTSRDKNLRAVLENTEKDFYTQLGTIFFGIPYEQVSKELRNKVLKRIVHGTNYMMREDTFVLTAGVKELQDGAMLLGYKLTTVKEFAKYLLGIYHKKFTNVSRHYSELQSEILAAGRLTSVLGYTRIFFGNPIDNQDVLRAAVAHEPQNLSVDILNKGFWKIYRDLVLNSHGDVRLKAEIHDSNLGQVRTEKLAVYKPLILEAMRNPVTIHGEELTIPVDWKQGSNWATME
jgi:DNA polymerase I-like protein with 3'-5' exonuclease and polymerase domains